MLARAFSLHKHHLVATLLVASILFRHNHVDAQYYPYKTASGAAASPSSKSLRRQDVINEWIRTIREAPKGHSLSPSWTSKSRPQVIGVAELPLQNEAANPIVVPQQNSRPPVSFKRPKKSSASPPSRPRTPTSSSTSRFNKFPVQGKIQTTCVSFSLKRT